MSDPFPTERLDEVVHQRHRLGVMVVLAEARRADFTYLKRVLDLTDGNLGRHLRVLEEAGFVTIDKVFEQGRPRTWAQLTAAGADALEAEFAAIETLIARSGRRKRRR